MSICTFTTNPSHYYNCSYQFPNATTIYYNFIDKIKPNCDCICPFKGDPDIAGPGVLSAFIATAWLTCLIAGIDAYCESSKSFNNYLSGEDTTDPNQNFERLLDRIEGLGLSTKTNSNSGHSVRAFHTVVHALGPRKASSWILSLFRKQHPRLQKFAELTLDSLCDIQVVTGSAIIIAGLVQINTMTFYHQQLVMDYWFLTLNSFWAGRMGDLNQNEDNDDWHYWTRETAILCTVLLSAIFQIIVIPRQRPAAWNPVRSGSCYIYHDKSTYDSQYMWIAGLVFFVFYLVIVLLSGLANLFRVLIGSAKDRKPTWVENSANKLRKIHDKYNDRYKEWRQTVLQVPTHPRIAPSVPMEDPSSSLLLFETKNRFIQPFQFIVAFILYFIPVLYWLFLRFLGLWSWGETRSVRGNVLMVMAYFAFAAWNTYDIIDLKSSNAYLVQDESEWGFGQVLPVALLGLIVVNMFDAAKGARKAEKEGRENCYNLETSVFFSELSP